MVHQVKPGQQACPGRAARHRVGHVVPESHAFSAQAIQIWGTQKAGAQMGYEVSPPLINHDEKNVLASRHRRTSNEPNEVRLELLCFTPMKVMRHLRDDNA
jgi:hypothetical protein